MWRIILFSLIEVSLFNPIKAQNHQKTIDSLKHVLETAPKDTHRVKALCVLCLKQKGTIPQEALKIGKDGLKLAQELANVKQIANCYYSVGSVYQQLGQYTESIEAFQQSINFSKKSNEELIAAKSYGALGLNHYLQGNYRQALENLNESKFIYEKNKRLESLNAVLNAIGDVYREAGNYAIALEYYQGALRFYEQNPIQNHEKLAQGYLNISTIHYYLKDFKKAEALTQSSLQIYKKLNTEAQSLNLAQTYNLLGAICFEQKQYGTALANYQTALRYYQQGQNLNGIAMASANIAGVYVKYEKIDTALILYEKADKIYQEIGAYSPLANVYNEVAGVYLKKGMPNIALKYIKNSLKIALDVQSFKDIEYSYATFAKVDSALGDFPVALAHYKLATAYKDSLLNEENSRQLALMNVRFETEKKENQIIALEKENALKAEKENALRQKTYVLTVAGSITILLLSAGFFLKRRSNQILQAKNTKIIQQKEEIEAQSEQIIYQFVQLKQLNDFKEAMSAMIIHDLKNPLSAIIALTDQQPTERNQIMVKQSSKQMLNLVLNILDVQKFESTNVSLNLKDCVLSTTIQNSIQQIQLLIENKNQQLFLSLSSNLLVTIDEELIERVLVNILTNAIKYTPNNGQIKIDAKPENPGWIKVSITDTGQGIPTDKLHLVFEKFRQVDAKHSGGARSTGLGLTFCKMVVEAHGGKIDLSSEVGIGTTFYFTIPQAQSTQNLLANTSTETDSLNSVLAPINTLLNTGTHSYNAGQLNHEEINYLLPFIKQLKVLEVYEVTEIRAIVQEITTTSPNIEAWKRQIDSAIQSCNEAEYLKLLNIGLT